MEMIGLVVIVILITLGMLFMAMFAFKNDDGKKVFTRKGLAYSSMSAILKTSVYEQSCVEGFAARSFPKIGEDLLEDCAVNFDTYVREDEVDGYSSYTCQGKHSCRFLEEQIGILLEDTLGVWNKDYIFESLIIDFNGIKKPILQVGNTCRGDRDTSGLFPIQTDAGLVENILLICD